MNEKEQLREDALISWSKVIITNHTLVDEDQILLQIVKELKLGIDVIDAIMKHFNITKQLNFIESLSKLFYISIMYGETKEQSISIIQSMDDEILEVLMLEINNIDKNDLTLRLRKKKKKKSSKAKTNNNNKTTNKEDKYKKEINKLNSEIIKLKGTLTDYKENLSKKKLNNEINLQQEFEEKEYDLLKRIEDLELINRKIENQLLDKNKLQQEFNDLKDENEILKESCKNSKKSQEHITKLKHKVSKYNNIEAQILLIQNKNDELTNRCLKAEKENEQIEVLKKNLKIEKTNHVNSLVEVSELQHKLQIQIDQNNKKEMEINSLKQVQNENINTTEVVSTIEFTDTNSNSISELNPDLREELFKLRQENINLKSNLSDSSQEKLLSLLSQNDHLTLLKDKLESNFLAKNDEYLDLLSQQSKLQNKYDALESEYNLLEDKFLVQCEESDLKINAINNNYKILENAKHDLEESKLNLQSKFETATQQYEELKNELEKLTDEKDELLNQQKDVNVIVQDMQSKNEEMENELKNLLVEKDKIENELLELKNEFITYKNNHKVSSKDLDKEIAIKSQKIKQLEFNLKRISRQRDDLLNRTSGNSGVINKSGKQMNEMNVELERLSIELTSKTKIIENLNYELNMYKRDSNTTVTSSSSESTNLNFNTKQMETYQGIINQLEEQVTSMSIAKANDTKKRYEIEQSLKTKNDEIKELNAQITSLRLQVERNKNNKRIPLSQKNHVIKKRSENKRENLNNSLVLRIAQEPENNKENNISVMNSSTMMIQDDDEKDQPGDCKQQ